MEHRSLLGERNGGIARATINRPVCNPAIQGIIKLQTLSGHRERDTNPRIVENQRINSTATVGTVVFCTVGELMCTKPILPLVNDNPATRRVALRA